MGTSVERASAVSEIRQKAEGYSIPNERIDGMDVLEVLDAAGKAIKKIRSGEGPYFLEIITYRYRGHSMGDPERYREAEEIKRWQEEDPIGIYHRQLIEKEIATEEELDTVIDQVEAEVEEAVQFAESSPDPEPDQLFVDIYADG